MNFWTKNILALLIGLGACVGSYYTGKNALHKLLNWERTTADVSSSNDIVRKATFTYNGQSYTINVGNGMDKKDNSRVATVIFPKEDPSKGEVKQKSLLAIPAILALFGLVLIAAAFFSFRHKLSGRPTVDPTDPEVIAQKEAMKQKAIEMKQKIDEFRNKAGI